MAKRKLPPNFAEWVSARRRHRLTDAQVQMARELGMNPRKLGGLANDGQEPWKSPVPQLIEQLYEERFGRRAPENVRSLEELARARDEKRSARKSAKRRRRDLEAERRADARLVGSRREIDGVPAALFPEVPTDLPVMPPPSTRLSEALVDIVKPDVPWPPKPGELKYLQASIEIAASVWNASLSRDPDERDAALARLAEAYTRTVGTPLEEALEFLRPIAARKLELHPNDLRYIVEVNVRMEGNCVIVDAASAYRRS